MKVSILGYGAVGKSLVRILSTNNYDISVFSSDEYIKNLRKLNVNSYSIESGAVNSPKQDLIFLSTKIYKVKNYLKILENLVGEGTLILPLQNGFYSFDLLKKSFYQNTAAASLSIVTSNTKSGFVNFTKKPKLSVSKPINKVSELMLENFILHSKNDITFEIFKNDEILLWRKFARIIALSTTCIYYKSSLGQVLQDERKYNFLIRSLEEMKSLAKFYKVDISLKQELEMINTISPNLRTSLYHSLENGHPGEYKYLIHEAIQRAKINSIPLNSLEKANVEILRRYPCLESE